MKNGATTSLDERILAAFADGAKLENVSALIHEVETAGGVATAEAHEAKQKALDPTLPAAGVTTARRAMDDAQFRAERMQTAAARLGERLTEIRSLEENGRRQAAYDKALATRDGLVAELDAEGPAISRLAHLAQRLEESDREIKSVDMALPADAPFLQLAGGSVANFLRADPLVCDGVMTFARDLDPQRAPGAPVRRVQREQLTVGRSP